MLLFQKILNMIIYYIMYKLLGIELVLVFGIAEIISILEYKKGGE